MKRHKNWRPALITAIALQVLVAVPASSQAANVYVDQRSIGGACSDAFAASAVTASTPWCTPARAVSGAPEGATVLVRAGTYSNIRALNIRRSQMLTFQAAAGELVTLQGSDTALENRAIYVKGSSNLRFQGFRITGGAYIWNSSFVQLSGNNITTVGTRFRNVSDVLVDRNDYHDFTGYERALETTAGVGESGAIRVVIQGNEFRSIEHDAISLYWRLQDITIEDNYIHAVHRPVGSTLHPDALQIAPQSEGSWGSMIVRRNRIVDFDQGLLIKDGVTRGLVLENNVIGSGGFFQASVYNAPSARITNNTVAGRLYLRGTTTNATVTNNVLSSFAVEKTSSVSISAYNLVDRTQYNPGYKFSRTDLAVRATFVDALNGDYRLTAASIGLDAGSPRYGAPSHDHVKNPRASGAGYDVGAYERQVAQK